MDYSYQNLKRKVAIEILSDWLVLGPLAVGLTLIIGTWALGFAASGALTAVGGLLALVSGAIWATKFFGGSKPVEERVIAKIKAEVARAEAQKLDALDARLQIDGDPRTNNALRDLRRLMQALRSIDLSESLIAADGVVVGIEELYADSIASLERTLDLTQTINGLSSAEARETLISQRDQIISGINQSIAEIGSLVGDLQVLSTSGDNGTQEELRARVSEQMQTVRKVHDQMQRWQAGDFSDDESHQTVVA